MNTALLFRPLTDSDQYEWLQPNNTIQQGSLEQLTQSSRGQTLIMVAPGEHITLTEVELPSRNRSAGLKAIPYMLEENLAEDVEDLHFALGAITPAGRAPVAVVRKTLLQNWLQTFHEANVNVSAIMPDYLLLPLHDNHWSVAVDGNRVLLRNGLWQGFACDLETWPLLLKLTLAKSEDELPQFLQRCFGPRPPTQDLVLALHSATEQATSLLELFSRTYRDSATINLLQGDYGRQPQWQAWLRPWKIAAALAAIWFAVQALQQGVDYWRLKQEQTRLQQLIVTTFQQAVPEARRIVNPRAQLNNHLQSLQRNDPIAASGFFDLLRYGGQGLLDFKTITLRGLRYKDNRLELELESNSLAIFDQLKQRLSQSSEIRVEMRVSKREDKVESRITLHNG